MEDTASEEQPARAVTVTEPAVDWSADEHAEGLERSNPGNRALAD